MALIKIIFPGFGKRILIQLKMDARLKRVFIFRL